MHFNVFGLMKDINCWSCRKAWPHSCQSKRQRQTKAMKRGGEKRNTSWSLRTLCDVNEIKNTSGKPVMCLLWRNARFFMLVPGFGLTLLLDGKVVQLQSDTRAAVECNRQKEAATNSAKRLPGWVWEHTHTGLTVPDRGFGHITLELKTQQTKLYLYIRSILSSIVKACVDTKD